MSFSHSAIGVDLGSSRFVIGVAKKGGVEVIVNEASYRQTPCIVSYGAERKLGDRSLAQVKKELKNTIFYPTRLLGDVNSNSLLQELPFNHCKIVLDNNRAQYKVNFEGQQVTLAPEQAVGSIFTEILDVLALNSIENKEMVVSVPAYFNQMQRQAVIDAAKVAGVEIIKLYNESSATVMNYGIFRKADLSPDTPRMVAFVDFGFSKSSVYVANIWKDRAEILFEETSSNLGVRNIDVALLQFYLKKFQQKHKEDLSDNPKALYRLMESIDKQRKILTANIEAAISVECLFEDIDFYYMMQREEFEQIGAQTLTGLQDLLAKCGAWLQQNCKDALHSVERVGGGTRIPFVEHLIQKALSVKSISKTLDANESVARGCAIQAASLSPLFKVAAYKVSDKSFSPITIKLQYEGEEAKSKILFDRGSEFNKTLSVSINKPLRLMISLAQPSNNLQVNEREILNTIVEKANPKESKFESKVCFYLDKNGLALLEKAELRENYFTEEKIPKKTAPAKTEEKKEGGEGDKMQVENNLKEEDFTIEKKERVRVTNISAETHLLYGLKQDQIQAMAQFENSVIQKEKVMKETQRAKYLLESFIYNTRTKVNESNFARYTSPAEKQEILQSLQKAESWLYEEGQNVDKDTYINNLSKLQQVSNGLYSRSKKIEEVTLYYGEAMTAFSEFEQRNSELLAHGSPVQLNETSQKISESMSNLKSMEHLLQNYSIQTVDQFNFDNHKNLINKNYETLNNILSNIKSEKEKREREEKLRQEEEKKRQEEEKKKQEDSSKQKPESEKMEIEEPEKTQ